MKTQQPILIFSVHKNDVSDEKNKIRHAHILVALDVSKIEYVEALGKYKDVYEQSIIIPYTLKNSRFVRSLCKLYRQDCFIEIDSIGRALIITPKKERDEVVNAGRMIEVPSTEAFVSDGYTYINDKYFIIKKAA